MQRDGKHFLSHTAIYLIARGLPGIVAFLAIPLFSRLLSPTDYGEFALVNASVILLNALLFQWLRLALVRFLPAFKDDTRRLKSTLVTAACFIILALGVIAGLSLLLPIPHEWKLVLPACWLMLAIQAAFDLCCEYSRGMLQPWRYMGLQVARSSAMVVLGVALVKLGMGWWGPMLGTGAGMAMAVAYAFRRDWADVRLLMDRQTLRKVCQYGIPLSVTVALAVLISSSDRYLIAWFKGESGAGLYSVAVDFTSQTLNLLMLVVNMAMFPLAVRAFENHGREAAQEQMRYNASLLMAVGLPCVVGLSILAPGISNCFLGKSFRATAADIMPLVALGTFLSSFKAYHFDAAFQFAHRTIYQVWIVLFVAVVNIALNLIAIPIWGINGAAVASVVAYIISIALTAYLGRRHFVLPFPGRACVQVLAAGGAMALVLLPFRHHVSPLAVVAEIALGAGLYGVILLACNFLELRESVLRRLYTAKYGAASRGALADVVMTDAEALNIPDVPSLIEAH